MSRYPVFHWRLVAVLEGADPMDPGTTPDEAIEQIEADIAARLEGIGARLVAVKERVVTEDRPEDPPA